MSQSIRSRPCLLGLLPGAHQRICPSADLEPWVTENPLNSSQIPSQNVARAWISAVASAGATRATRLGGRRACLKIPLVAAMNQALARSPQAPAWCVCVCVPPWTKGLTPPLFPFYTGRGVWHSRPTTRNEAVGGSGKRGLISPAYLLISPQAVTPIFLFFDSWSFA